MEQPTAVISGAGSGIGRACAQALARRGYRVTLLARTRSHLEETASLCQGAATVWPVDVADPEAVSKTVGQIVASIGRIDALVHCAGVAPVRPITEMDPAEWRNVIDTNLSSAFYLARAVWPEFVRRGGGVIVNVSSVAARDPFPGFAAYGAAKAGLNLFGLSAAREGHPHRIRVHTIAPGAVETGMFRKIIPAEQYSADRTLRPEDVAQVICQCVVGDLKYTSGEVIYLHKEV